MTPVNCTRSEAASWYDQVVLRSLTFLVRRFVSRDHVWRVVDGPDARPLRTARHNVRSLLIRTVYTLHDSHLVTVVLAEFVQFLGLLSCLELVLVSFLDGNRIDPLELS